MADDQGNMHESVANSVDQAQVAIDNAGGPLPVNMLAGIAVVIAGATGGSCGFWDACPEANAYAVSLGAVGFCIAGAKMALNRREDNPKLQNLLSMVSLLWWTVGAVYTTFSKPFDGNTLNGYFGAWAGFISAVFIAGPAVSNCINKFKGLQTEGLLVAAAAVAAVDAIVPTHSYTNNEVLVIAISGVTFLLSLLLVLVPALQGQKRFIAYVLIAMWIAGAGISTFDGPFKALGNGYCAVWLALYCSVALLGANPADVAQDAINYAGVSQKVDAPPNGEEVGV
eukprot:CAMPEP_0175139752 /NCGR_PEP_ID=MMETSP0087-20121206/11088_1 /TAXON_ID=136419 /ORGANISM="Unknown Unknown, Strain D1" /LENGTH=282 /DNA_ID=CAMNT_0016422819 /DNA_START=34 /DNA_END=882 /DNA_ORIENTATION=+